MILRAAREGDAAAIAAIYRPHVEGSTVSFELAAPDAAAIAARMAAAAPLYPWLVAVEDDGDASESGAVLGYAYAGLFRTREAYRWATETSVYVAADALRRGVGRRLYRALLATLAAQGFTEALGVIALPNDPSVALHEAVGFARAGLFPAAGWKLGCWVDVGYWQRSLGNGAAPAELRPFAEVGVRQ